MNGDRICILTSFFKKRRINWQTSKCVMAKELQTLMAKTVVVNPKDNLNGFPCPLSEFEQNRLKENLENEAKNS